MADDVDNFLAHYGVKGMKWGVRNAAEGLQGSFKKGVADRKAKRKAKKAERKANSAKALAAGYSAEKRAYDVKSVGEGGTRRIEKRVANGEKIGKARVKEYARSTGQGVAAGAAVLAVMYGPMMANKAAGNLASNINAKRGAEAARNLFADSKGLTSYSTIALSFDKAKGAWG